MPSALDAPIAPLRRAPALRAVPGVVHGFSTRQGGVTPGPIGPLNLARRPGETDATLVENWRRVVRALGPGLADSDLALLEQVHGADVARVESGRGPLVVVARADGAITTRPGVILTVRTADCVPVLLAALDPSGRACGIGVAHAGWRGVVADVVGATVAALREESRALEVVAAIGPHIGRDAFEVGPDVVAAFAAAGLGASVRDDGRHIDLELAVRAQLARVAVARVERVRGCTWSDADLLHSHRRDAERSGRLSGVIALVPAGHGAYG